MNTNKLRVILYFIIFVIAATIAIQVYWNYKNYQTNKQQLLNDVQVSLDNAVDTYYENLTKVNTRSFFIDTKNNNAFLSKNKEHTTIISSTNNLKTLDVIDSNLTDRVSVLKRSPVDSIFALINDRAKDITIWNPKKNSQRQSHLESLTTKIVVSISNDSLKLKDIDSLLHIELNRKALNVDYGLTLNLPKKEIQLFNILPNTNKRLSTTSKSAFLPEQSELKIHFKNETKVILKRIFGGILISTLLVLAVISCLFYLHKIINKQKQLAEVKNDLISNITHEFKTPIATISVALESIKDFNVLDDKEKTKKYLNLSNNQLSKLNLMVEKLLETATLDSENLELNQETTDIAVLIYNIIEKHKMQTDSKSLIFNASAEETMTNVDPFHFENAINNIIDNAIKYGGDSISVSIKKKSKHTEIAILDNGNTLTKQQATQIFDKFYRVPKGNTHNIKGFGIGLYYTKKIIEKHNGNITVSINNGTTFKITIPNEQ